MVSYQIDTVEYPIHWAVLILAIFGGLPPESQILPVQKTPKSHTKLKNALNLPPDIWLFPRTQSQNAH